MNCLCVFERESLDMPTLEAAAGAAGDIVSGMVPGRGEEGFSFFESVNQISFILVMVSCESRLKFITRVTLYDWRRFG